MALDHLLLHGLAADPVGALEHLVCQFRSAGCRPRSCSGRCAGAVLGETLTAGLVAAIWLRRSVVL